jgi:hypothetical protein
MTTAREEAERRYRKSAFLVQAFFRGAQWQAGQPVEITDDMVERLSAEWDRHEMWKYGDDGRIHCECGAVLPDSDYPTAVLGEHQARAALEAALGGEA